MRTYDPKKNADTHLMGRRGYVAPEQYSGMGQTDARTYIFGWGMTMHYLLSGMDSSHLPYEAIPICEINANLPIGLEYIISKMYLTKSQR